MAKTVKCSEVHNKCIYWKRYGYDFRFCDYMCMEGKRRGCKPEECNKFESKNKKE